MDFPLLHFTDYLELDICNSRHNFEKNGWTLSYVRFTIKLAKFSMD